MQLSASAGWDAGGLDFAERACTWVHERPDISARCHRCAHDRGGGAGRGRGRVSGLCPRDAGPVPGGRCGRPLRVRAPHGRRRLARLGRGCGGRSRRRPRPIAWLAVAFDPTHDRRTNRRYLTVAVGRDYADVPPTSGTFEGTGPGVLSATKRSSRVATPHLHPAAAPAAGPRLTTMSTPAPEALVDDFAHQGYVVVGGLLGEAALDRLQQEMEGSLTRRGPGELGAEHAGTSSSLPSRGTAAIRPLRQRRRHDLTGGRRRVSTIR